MTTSPLPIRNAHHVGSFLRSPRVLEAWAQRDAGTITREQCAAIEDEAISASLEALPRSLDITDGEERRFMFHTHFFEKLDGFRVTYDVVPLALINRDGSRNGSGASNGTNGTREEDAFKGPLLSLDARVRNTKKGLVPDFLALVRLLAKSKAQAGRPVSDIKMTLPSPVFAVLAVKGWEDVYGGDLDAFHNDIVEAYRVEMQNLYDAGCRRIQLDECMLPCMCDENFRGVAHKLGITDIDGTVDRWISLIQRTLEFRPAGMVAGIHLCHGNFKSVGFSKGSYEFVAEKIFTRITALQVWLLEYDDEAISGTFEPVRFIPKDKVVALGVVSSKFPELEDAASVQKAIETAEKIVQGSRQQLALTLQCGFGSSHHGNLISPPDQWKKLQHVADLADRFLLKK